MARTKTTKVPKKCEQEKEKTAKIGEQVRRIAEMTSYRKEKELRRGTGARKKDFDLNDGAAATQPSDLAGQQLAILKLRGKMDKKVKKEMRKEVEVKEQVEVGDGEESEAEEVVEMRPSAKSRGKAKSNEAVELVSTALDVTEKEADEQVNKDLKANKAWLKGKWGGKPTSSLKGKEKKIVTPKRVRQAVDVIKAWNALPPRESDKASTVKMVDDALKLLTLFGSPTPSQPASKPTEGVSSSKRKTTPSTPSPSIKKGK
ncbi:hypothetical protein Scep_029967 [Stephania cephalantha]|uniref:Uncharacterized protein n=1 Tax=Stephania cephalantha TaxID=152367 RepID=A0AAP0DYX2_9MAGN